MTTRKMHGEGEAGMSLIEVLIASLLTVVVMGMGYGIFMTTSRTSVTIRNRAANANGARVAINLLETNLRYASGVLLCGSSGLTTTACPSPTDNLPAVLIVYNTPGAGLGPTQPPCTEWEFVATGLARKTNSNVAFTTVAPTAAPWPYPSVTAGHPVASPGFSEPLPRLVESDFTVNVEPVPVAADAVTVHDDISPNNLVGTTTNPAVVMNAPTGGCPV